MKNIGVITSSRADYGLLYWVLQNLKNSNKNKLKIIVSGMHLSRHHGLTYKEIIADNFKIDSKVKFPSNSKNNIDLIKSFSTALNSYSKSFEKLNINKLIILGDRYEIFAAAISASIMQIPIFHLHGGEATYGAIDEYFRNCITKLSSVHFVSTDIYKKRVIQMGEHPKNVFNVGALGIENINKLKLLNKNQLQKKFKLNFKNKFFLVTMHPTTLELKNSIKYLKELFLALDNFKDYSIVFTSSNSDISGTEMTNLIKKYTSNNNNSYFFSNLGQLNYLSVLKNCDILIGNSSSGIIEAPSFKKPTINIGNRQKGRVKAINVIDCNPKKENIILAIRKGLSKKFSKKIQHLKNPYDGGNSSKKIVKIVLNYNTNNMKSEFFDVNYKL